MRHKSYIAMLIAAAAMLAPGFSPYTVYADDNPARETAGEKLDDATITSKVKMELLSHRGTSAINTDVDTRDGVVTLTGKAKNVSEKELATEVAQKVKGVKKVINEIAVLPSE